MTANMDEATGQYEFIVRENGRRIDGGPIPDPFIHTTIRPRGVRAALRVLFGRTEFVVHVTGRLPGEPAQPWRVEFMAE